MATGTTIRRGKTPGGNAVRVRLWRGIFLVQVCYVGAHSYMTILWRARSEDAREEYDRLMATLDASLAAACDDDEDED